MWLDYRVVISSTNFSGELNKYLYMSTDSNDTSKLARLEQHISHEIQSIKQEVDDLYRTVYKGNGHPSLVTRVSDIEGKLRGLRDHVDEKFTHMNRETTLKIDSIHQKLESKFGRLEGWIETKFNGLEHTVRLMTENRRMALAGSWQLKAALITALAAIAAAALTYFNN